jgi:hypothetical protein
MAALEKVLSEGPAFHRAVINSLRLPEHVPPGMARHAACRCAAWRFTDSELGQEIQARRRTFVLSDEHRLR